MAQQENPYNAYQMTASQIIKMLKTMGAYNIETGQHVESVERGSSSNRFIDSRKSKTVKDYSFEFQGISYYQLNLNELRHVMFHIFRETTTTA